MQVLRATRTSDPGQVVVWREQGVLPGEDDVKADTSRLNRGKRENRHFKKTQIIFRFFNFYKMAFIVL